MKEITVALIKSHLWEDYGDAIVDVIFEILKKYTSNGLKIVKIGKFNMDEQTGRRFYSVHDGKSFFNGLVKAMIGPTIGMFLEGEDAILKVRTLNGATNPSEAVDGTLRAKYGRKESGPYNAVHGSDSPVSADNESCIIFDYIM